MDNLHKKLAIGGAALLAITAIYFLATTPRKGIEEEKDPQKKEEP